MSPPSRLPRLSLVQAVISGGLVFLAVLAERVFGLKVGPRQWLGIGLTALGLVFADRHAALHRGR
jgi:drug/metabolite transporter (DMT)-like permease